MIKLVSAAAVALVLSSASAQNAKSEVTNPGLQNSGAGIAGQPGNKNGPAVKPGTVGSATGENQTDNRLKQQDATGVQGLPGNKSGPAEKQK